MYYIVKRNRNHFINIPHGCSYCMHIKICDTRDITVIDRAFFQNGSVDFMGIWSRANGKKLLSFRRDCFGGKRDAIKVKRVRIYRKTIKSAPEKPEKLRPCLFKESPLLSRLFPHKGAVFGKF